MKTKEKKPNPLERIKEDLSKLGFCGGELNSVRGKKTYGFTSIKRSPLVQLNSTSGKGKDQKQHLAAMRLRVEPECEITITLHVKDNKLTWEYDSAGYDKFAKGTSGLHSRLVKILGRQPGE